MAETVSAKTPSEIVDYRIDWAAQLAGDSISASAWAVQDAANAAVTLSGDATSGTAATVFVAGGTANSVILLTNTITTSGGRTLTRTLSVPVVAYQYAGASHAETVLAAIEAVIERRATVDQQSYSIEGRSLARMPIDDLLRFRSQYRAEVANEQAARAAAEGRGSSRRIRTAFTW